LTPTLAAALDGLQALLATCRQTPQAADRIMALLRHPELNIALADDELDTLAQQLAADCNAEDNGDEVGQPETTADAEPLQPSKTVEDYLAILELFADQYAQENCYGLQDSCLLVAEALRESALTPTLAAALDGLQALLATCRQTPQATDRIMALLRHPELNIALADDELDTLAQQLAADCNAEDISGDFAQDVPPPPEPAWANLDGELATPEPQIIATEDKNDSSPPPVSAAMRELVELLETEAAVIDNQLQAIAVDDRASVEHGLEQLVDTLECYVNAANMAGFAGLALVCQQVTANVQFFQQHPAAFSLDSLALLREWTDQVRGYLDAFNEEDMGLPLLVMLGDDRWPCALPPETAMTILEKLRPTDDGELTQEIERRPQTATDDDVSLALPDDVNQELLDILLQELPVQTQQFSEAVQHMQSGGSLKHLEIAQRVAHTVKGSANTVGVKGMATLTHHLEDILVACAKEQRLPNTLLLNVLVDAADCLEAMTEALIGTGDAPGDARTVLQSVLDLANQIDKAGIQAFDELAASAPPPPRTEGGSEAAPENEADAPQTVMVRIPSVQVEHLFRMSGESIILNTQVSERLRRMKNQMQAMEAHFLFLRQLGDDLEEMIDLKDLSGRMQPSLEQDFDALEMDQYNELHTASRRMVEAAVDARAMSQDIWKELEQMNALLEAQQRLGIDTQESIMQTRLVPIASIVPRLQRGLRQTCRLTGKQSALNVSGERLLIDGDLLNALVDPLMHILRNAVDHGIETEDVRLAADKPRTGGISIEFDHDGNDILVRCRDDGRGLDFAAIRTAAEKKGILEPGQPVSEDDIKRLILRPNFSTRTQTTQTSGRGVGMDAVYTQVLALGGTLALHSVHGQGTTVELKVPLPLSRLYALLANAGPYHVAIASKGVKQILYPGTGTLVTQADGEEALVLDTISYPVISLRRLLHIPDHRQHPRPYAAILLVENEGGLTAVMLDAISDGLDVVVKNLGHYIKKIPGFIGAAIMGDSSVCPVLDMPGLLRAVTTDDYAHHQTDDVAEVESHLPTVLVVDDSLSQRRALEQIMQDVGFQVRTARDGIEAADMLTRITPDIVLTDLEMPRMNGIELTAHIRTKPAIRHLPIIMITSRTTQKHRLMAEEAGVNFYLVKPVREDDLLMKVQGLLEAAAPSAAQATPISYV
jgi:chemosensory pili system protein ChpA (sensor histidine kinase/response regulator)